MASRQPTYQIEKCLLLVVLFSCTSFSQLTDSLQHSDCSIVGRIIDQRTGEPLNGVTVLIEGTYKGTASNSTGRYCVTKISPGFYNVKATYIGYTSETRNIILISDNKPDTLNFALTDWCDTYADSARLDLQEGRARILVSGLVIRQLPEDVEKQLTKKYGFEYVLTGCTSFCDGPYNEVMYRYLEKRNGKNWLEILDKEFKRLVEEYQNK